LEIPSPANSASSASVVTASIPAAAGTGVAIVPLLPSGVVTRGHAVTELPLADDLRPIDSGLLIRRGEQLNESSRRFAEFVRNQVRPADRVAECSIKSKSLD
jgi:DNA-binding transcriptional LysR family regulator